MKITAKLAVSQLKINRSRTIWTLIGIALSTALITTVCSFVASGNAMLVEVLGEDYGAYGSSYMYMLLLPAVLFGIIIVSMSVVVVSNVFRVSASERTTQFGVLKSIGATNKQIMSSVMYESLFVSVIGILFGMAIGLLLAFAGICVTNYFLNELNGIIHIMMTEMVLWLDFIVSWQALLAAASISFLSVFFSAWVPAHKAAKAAAIDSIRGTGQITMEAKQLNTSPLVQKLFGFEGTLAVKNMKRNRRVFHATVISLTVAVVLFINLSALNKQANQMNAMLNPDVDETVWSDYASVYSTGINEVTGAEESEIAFPIDSETGNAITEKLRLFEDTKTFGVGNDVETYDAIIPREQITQQMLSTLSDSTKQQSYEVSAEIIVVDQENYVALCERAGVSYGSTILLNHYTYNDNGKAISFAPLDLKGGAVQLIGADGSITEMPVQGILTEGEIPKELFWWNCGVVRLVVPQAAMRSYIWYSSPANEEEFIDYANMVMGEMFPKVPDTSYREAGFTTRVYKINDYSRVMNMAIVVALIFMYSFVVLLILIGLTNVISTMSANVLMRSREFAVLQSIGMTPEGLKHMLNLESILCSAKALFYGVPIAILISYFINLPIRKIFPIPYELPLSAILLCAGGVILITLVTTRFAARRLRNRNIMEAIRSESGR